MHERLPACRSGGFVLAATVLVGLNCLGQNPSCSVRASAMASLTVTRPAATRTPSDIKNELDAVLFRFFFGETRIRQNPTKTGSGSS
jgi:hypothetical protein